MRGRSFGYWVTAAAGLVSFWVYPLLPPRVPMHFAASGQPDGYGPKLFAVLVGPVMVLVLRLVMGVLPRLDPRRENYRKFRETYWLFVNGLLLFIAVLHVTVLGYALGAPVRVDRVGTGGLGVLLVVIGNYLGRIEPNWFIGIRTPWTLSSEHVWRRTHRLGGWILVLGGLSCIGTIFVSSKAALPIFVGTIALVVVIPVVISYVLWKREGN
jgi:uncharacterized membrane protein